MAAHVLQYKYWNNGGSLYYVGDVDLVGKPYPKWHYPARLLGLSPVEFIALLQTSFNAVIIGFNGSLLQYAFKSETDADKFCKYINTKAKSVSFIV